MRSEAWENRLCNLIRKFKSSCDVGSFRNDYRDVVAQSGASRAKADLLLQARECLEAWFSLTLPEPPLAYEQWHMLYNARAGKDRIPESVLEALLRRLPAAEHGAQYWEEFLLRCEAKRLVYALLNHRLVRRQDLNKLVQKKPAEFYHSVVLDVMVERSALKVSRPLWDECTRGGPRPPGLLSREQLLVRCYSMSAGKKHDDWMLAFLLNYPQDREVVLDMLLGERETAVRFCRYLTFGQLPDSGRRSRKEANRIPELLMTWMCKCEAVLENEIGARNVVASFVLALIRLCLLAGGKPPVGSQLAEATGRTAGEAVRRVLREIEGDRSSPAAGTVLVLVGDELYGWVQDYLRRLPVGRRSGAESPERALRYERYLGIRTSLQQILSAMDEPLEEGQLRDAIEVALFNCGLRPIGAVGEQGVFDPHSHEAETPGVLSGDSVIITRAGRRLGDEVEGLVLRKARVRGISPTNRTSPVGDLL